MKNYFIVLIMLFILIIITSLMINKEGFQTRPANGYIEACNELNQKRVILRSFIQELRSGVTDISSNLTSLLFARKENMGFQRSITDYCLENLETNPACKVLASVDKHSLKEMPDLDIFYYNVLYGSYDISNLLYKLNYYADIVKCPAPTVSNRATFDASDNLFSVKRDIGIVNTETLFIEIQKLSPYYLSPEVIAYILRFLISREKLEELNYTSSDWIERYSQLATLVKARFT